MLKKFQLDKINFTKNDLFVLSGTPAHHFFTFNSRVLYELKHKVHPLKVRVGFFFFSAIKGYKFVQQKAWTL